MTPETDAAVKASNGQWSFVLKETCQRLERERDEWARLCGQYKQERDEAIRQRDETNTSSKYACDYNYEQKLKAERERDEAREHLAATKHYLTKERDDALAQIVQAECRAERFCQERDEAREALENHMAATIHTCHDECKRHVCVLRRERDEVRKEAEYYKERYEQIKDQYGR